ncbi:MAG: HAD-superfamily hydrolase, subfamily variant 3 [Bryobacterales bacterium]|nr:HAD-superfamily hydrolase, subfamily variant 3 [Bryobacterales bacterium]
MGTPLSSSTPRTIIFDLGKVIVPFDFSRGYRALETLCPHPAGEIPAKIMSTGLVTRLDTGTIDPEAFVQSLARELEMRITYPEFCTIWSSIFLPGTLIPEELVENLSTRYRLLLLSNTNAIHFDSIQENYPILRHFHAFVLSYKLGMMKPDPAIYRRAAELAECEPAECLFIDDLAENVAGAERVGMPAIQFFSFQQLERELAARGVRWD